VYHIEIYSHQFNKHNPTLLFICPLISQAWDRLAAASDSVVDGDIYEKIAPPPEYTCPICKKLIRDAVKVPCCSTIFCDECK